MPQVLGATGVHATVEERKNEYRKYADLPFHTSARINIRYSLAPTPVTKAEAVPPQAQVGFNNFTAQRMQYPQNMMSMHPIPNAQHFYPGSM